MLLKFGGHGHNLELMSADEVGNVVADIAGDHVGLNTLQSVEHGSTGLVDMTVCFGHIVDLIVSKSMLAHDEGIDSIINRGIMGDNYIRRYIAGNTAAAFYNYPVADLATLMEHGVGRKDRACTDLAVAGDGNTIADNHLVGELAVVAEMGLGHDERITAYGSGANGTDTAVDDYLLTDYIVVADNAKCLFTVPAEILWIRTDDRPLIYLVVTADTRTAHYAYIGHNDTVVANLNVGIDKRKRIDLDIVANLGSRIYMC